MSEFVNTHLHMYGEVELKLLLLLCALVLVFFENAEVCVVTIASGRVRGYKDPDFDIFTFYNIPYATAPTGPHKFKESIITQKRGYNQKCSLALVKCKYESVCEITAVIKFQAPLPAPVWQKTLDAVVDRGIVCPQPKSHHLLDKTVQEDCLIANIYVPDIEDATNLPVVVNVHWGGYQFGYGEIAKPKYLVQSKKIIVVNFNYRLNAHGFLCLGTEDVPGNAGMKDQVALLRWVKKNIASFGGNPNDTTIHGCSAGSSAVDLLMLSKIARGLFNKVVPGSGANVGVWSVQIDPFKTAKDHAKKLNFTEVDDIYALEEFYKTTDLKLLTQEPYLNEYDSTFALVPCVERQTGGEVFLDDAPVNILKSGQYEKLPMLYGFANMEGILRVSPFKEFVNGMNKKFSDFLPADLQFESDEEKENIAKEVKEFYFYDKAISDETMRGYIDYFGDIMFAYPTLRAVKLHVEAGHDKIYLYEYSYGAEKDKVKGGCSNEKPRVY